MDYMITRTKEGFGFKVNLSVSVQFQWNLVSCPDQLSSKRPKMKMEENIYVDIFFGAFSLINKLLNTAVKAIASFATHTQREAVILNGSSNNNPTAP